MESWTAFITPAVVIAGVAFLWRVFKAQTDSLRLEFKAQGEAIRTEVHSLADRVNTLADRMSTLEGRMNTVEVRVDSLAERVARIEGVLVGAFQKMPIALSAPEE